MDPLVGRRHTPQGGGNDPDRVHQGVEGGVTSVCRPGWTVYHTPAGRGGGGGHLSTGTALDRSTTGPEGVQEGRGRSRGPVGF